MSIIRTFNKASAFYAIFSRLPYIVLPNCGLNGCHFMCCISTKWLQLGLKSILAMDSYNIQMNDNPFLFQPYIVNERFLLRLIRYSKFKTKWAMFWAEKLVFYIQIVQNFQKVALDSDHYLLGSLFVPVNIMLKIPCWAPRQIQESSTKF